MTDDDPVLHRSQFVTWLKTNGLIAEMARPATPSANGAAEALGRMILWMGRTLAVDSALPSNMWPLLYDSAVYLLNHFPTKSLNWWTPLGKLFELCGHPDV